MKKRLAILGSTGSIGTQTLEVAGKNPEQFSVEVLTAGSNCDLLIEQALTFMPDVVVIADKSKYQRVHDALSGKPIKVFAGQDSIEDVASHSSVDTVVAAIVGFAGLRPVINAIKAGKQIALANKEVLVVAGALIKNLLHNYNSVIIPVDSEHSAIFQCLVGEPANGVEKIILTASGGPFRNMSAEEIKGVTKNDALQHPTWNMGDKITIDSASMMNKGLEVIEAHWLFDISAEHIEVVIHPQSIIHSMVQFTDGSIKAQLSPPDMRLPIQYALAYPERLYNDFQRLNLNNYNTLSFEQPDIEKFRNLALAYDAIKKGGNMPCILNAANEIAVDAFLHEKAGFYRMSEIIEKTMRLVDFINEPSFDDLAETDALSREIATTLI
ncbi:MAG: 1-deoxy-D-xylulose-5-phosphate reductoisomerase [Bacteroidales bacterium]|nr:1-deoxy-D-xylulose-5-phosphate reductoisomerase [Bacteroidales bacterium]